MLHACWLRADRCKSIRIIDDWPHRSQNHKPHTIAGLAAIREGKVAALVLSGGQGTRLGFDGPKGMYDIGLPSAKPIFQLLAERVKGLSTLAGVPGGRTLPFYVMTSPLNHEATRCVQKKIVFSHVHI
jgi:UDP-N-acetylglucosamine pyrophosphorylase